MSRWTRQIHRWLSIVFTVTVIANFVALARGHGAAPPDWITYSPLPPLFLLLFTGLYLFALPYLGRTRATARSRSAAPAASTRSGGRDFEA